MNPEACFLSEGAVEDLPRRPTRAVVDCQALVHNLQTIEARLVPGADVLAVVKADAYGLGAGPIALALQQNGVKWFGVAMLEEGLELRRAGIKERILVLGGLYPQQEPLAWKNHLTPVISSCEQLKAWHACACQYQQTLSYHLKLDTGMGRLGVLPGELPHLLEMAQQLPGVQMEGVMTHFACADAPQDGTTSEQIRLFRQLLQRIRQAGHQPRHIHAANSAGLFNFPQLEATLVRPGLFLYGARPWEQERLQPQPVLHLYSRIVSIKELPPGTGVSYGHQYITAETRRVAAVPVGYADGYSRLLSGTGQVLVQGCRAPVLGAVCMDWLMIDVTGIPEAQEGDTVTLFGSDGQAWLSAEEVAGWAGTIAYELFCGVGKRVPRLYVNGAPWQCMEAAS